MASRRLDAYLYYVLGDRLPADTHLGNLEAARSWGFKTSDAVRLCRSLDEVYDFIHYWDTGRKNLPVATDGIVLKGELAGAATGVGLHGQVAPLGHRL